MPAELDLEVCEPALGVRRAQRADAVDNEAIVSDGRLEALQAAPCHTVGTRVSRGAMCGGVRDILLDHDSRPGEAPLVRLARRRSTGDTRTLRR